MFPGCVLPRYWTDLRHPDVILQNKHVFSSVRACDWLTPTGGLAVRCWDDVVVVERFSAQGLVFDYGDSGGAGHPGNVRQAPRWSLSHRGAAAFQKELAVIDDPGAFWEKRRGGRG